MSQNLFSGDMSKNNNMLQAQEALSNLKRQIGSLDSITNPANLYYSLQRNIESFENQLEGQMNDIEKVNKLTDDPNKLANLHIQSSIDMNNKNKLRNVSTRARDQYKSWRKSYAKKNILREDKLPRDLSKQEKSVD